MLASQLLRVLQTMPSEIKHETCVFDAEEQNTKEHQDTTFYDSKSFGKEADSLPFEGKEVCQVNGSKRTNDPIAFEVNGGGKHWNINVDHLPNNCELGRLDSPRKSYAANNEEKLQSSPSLELFNIDRKSESSDFVSPQMTSSYMIEKDSDFFTDKNILEYESPELTVRNKEINFHIVKDICIDDGMPTKDKILIESCKDDQPGAEGDINNVFVVSNGLEAESLGNTSSVGETECGKIGESYDELLAQCRSKSLSGYLSADDSAKNCEIEDSTQNFSGEEDSKISESAVEAGAKEDIDSNTKLYDSKIEGGSITFNFNSPEQVVSNITHEQTENLKEQLIESGTVHAHRDGNANNLSDSSLAQCSSINAKAPRDEEEQAVDVKNEDSDRSSEAVLVQQHISSKDLKNEMTHNGQGIEQHSVKHGHNNSDEVSVVSQLRYDEGESSFTAAGLMTFSGPIAYSGSLSLRSDGSAASSRTFAFPILQSEWNSSPVRMAKADRRHFRKHRGWRSGLFCCRF